MTGIIFYNTIDKNVNYKLVEFHFTVYTCEYSDKIILYSNMEFTIKIDDKIFESKMTTNEEFPPEVKKEIDKNLRSNKE